MNDNQLIRPEDERYEKLTWENAPAALQDRGREIMREARFADHPIELNQAVRQAAAEQDTTLRQAVENTPHVHQHVMITGELSSGKSDAVRAMEKTMGDTYQAALKTAMESHEMTWAALHPRVETEHSNKAAVSHKQEHGFGNSM